MSPPLVFLDTETTSLRPDRQAWEVAMIRRDSDGEQEIAFLLDVDLTDSDPVSLKIGRFYDRHPYGRWLSNQEPVEGLDTVAPDEAADIITRWTYDAVLVVNNPTFDHPILDGLLRAHRYTPAWHYRPIDVIAVAAGYLARHYNATPPLPWRSEEISETLGVLLPAGEQRHTALGDTRWVRALWDAMTTPHRSTP